MSKLQTKEVYVPAHPSLENGGTPAKAEGVSYITGKPLERKEKYVFSKEELEKLLGDAFEAGAKSEDPFLNSKNAAPTIEGHLQSLF